MSEQRQSGWHRRANRERPIPETYTHLPSGEPVNFQPDIDAELQYWCDLYGADPYGFALNMFEWGKPYSFLAGRTGPYAFQCEILRDMSTALAEDPSIYRMAVASGKGSGKTAMLAVLFLWHVMTHRYSATNLLGVTGDAIDQRIWAEIGRWYGVCKARHQFRRYRGGRLVHIYHDTWYGAYQLWAKNTVEALFGSHAPYLGYLVDEACGIPSEVLAAVESGWQDEHVFACYISNPTRLRSRFRQCFPGGTLAHLWHSWQIDSRTTERHNPARVQELLDEAGGDEDDPRFRVNVRGLFPLVDSEQFITDAMIEIAHERYVMAEKRTQDDAPEGHLDQHEPLVIGVDVARKGSNKTVFIVRQGGRILVIKRYTKKEIDESADLLMDLMNTLRHWQPQAYIDIVGYGAGVYANCKRAGYVVHEVNSSSSPQGPHAERFENRRMELWDFMKIWLRQEGRLNPRDQVLARQLVGPAAFVNEHHGLLQLESKDSLESRGLESPDEADALAYSFGGLRAPVKHGQVLSLVF